MHAVAIAFQPDQPELDSELRYVSDADPGIRRVRSGRGFRYVSPTGATVRDPEVRARIRSLAIPPAWTDVWICPTPDGHIQATGRDARGRKQYRYHERWTETRDCAKFDRLTQFAAALPTIREAVDRDMARHRLDRRRVVATVVQLLDATLIRVGNEEYARNNRSFGLTTLRSRHVSVNGNEVRFRFRGKGGAPHDVAVRSPRVATVVRRCEELPGQELFQYLDAEGQIQDVGSAHVNEYLREVTGQPFSAKDFRTWAGTVAAATGLRELGPADTETARNRNVVAAIREAAALLRNTVAVCRRCYVHPAIIDAYERGEVIPRVRKPRDGLSPEETATLRLLESQQTRS